MPDTSSSNRFGLLPERRGGSNRITDETFRKFKPANIFEAREKLAFAQDKILGIQDDLSHRTRMKPGGEPMTPEEYAEWRVKAIGTMRSFEHEAEKLRRLIRAHVAHIGSVAAHIDPASASSLVEAAYGVFEYLRRENGLDVSALPLPVQKAIHAVSDYAVGMTPTEGALRQAKERADAAKAAERSNSNGSQERSESDERTLHPRRPRL